MSTRKTFYLLTCPGLTKAWGKCFSLLLLSSSCGLWAYDFPVHNPFLATIAGTPPEQQAKLMLGTVREAILGLADERVENAPDIFWDVAKPRFKLAWQDKPAPLIFIIAGTGGRFDSSKVEYLKKVYYQAGFHVIQISSPTSYDFVVSSSKSHRPGITWQDSEDIYHLMQSSARRAQSFRKMKVTGWYLTGYSLGALNAAFVARLDSEQKVFGFERVLLLNPPVNLESAIRNLDRLLTADVPGVDDSTTLFDHFFDKLAGYFRTHKSFDLDESMLFHVQNNRTALTSEEVALLIGVSFRLSLASMYFTSDAMTWSSNLIPKGFKLKRSDSRIPYFKRAMLCNFECYVEQVLMPCVKKPKDSFPDQQRALSNQRSLLFEQNSLPYLESWLKNARHVGVMHNADDYIIDQKGLDFLYDTFDQRVKIYPLGGHLGNLQHHRNVRDMLGFIKGKGFPDD